MTTDIPLTPEEEKELQQFVSGYGGTPMPEEKHNVHKFLHDVVTTKDTTKLGFLTEDEVGFPALPQRTLKELALFCKDVANMDYYSDYFKAKSEILTATSLSKEAKLLELAVVTRREVADVTKKERKKNKGWFKKKGDKSEEQL